MPRHSLLSGAALVSAGALVLTACQFSGGTTTVTGNDGACTQISVPAVNIASAPTTLPGIGLAPCPTVPPTTAPPTSAPPTTLPPTTSAPPTTTPPAASTAAARHGWGAPLAGGSDEFSGASVDTTKWWLPGECWPANDTVVAGRCASHVTVQDGCLRQTGTADGKTGWLASKLGQRYGRWEVRARVLSAGPGPQFHPVLIAWPDDDRWPQGGEYDFFESDARDTHATAFMHHPADTVVQTEYNSGPLDLAAWHAYGFEWTPAGLKGYIDGVLWFHHTKPGFDAPRPMHQTIQLDNFVGTSGMPLTFFDIDWARAYPAP